MRRKACSRHESDVQYLQNFDRKNLKETDYLKGLSVDWKFTLLWIEENMVRSLKNGYISSGQGPPSVSGAHSNGYWVTENIRKFSAFWETINIPNKTRLHVQAMHFLYLHLPATPPVVCSVFMRYSPASSYRRFGWSYCLHLLPQRLNTITTVVETVSFTTSSLDS